MKRYLISLLIIFVFVNFTIIPLCVSASNEDVEPVLLFDMDLSDCTEESPKQIKDAANLTGTTIQYGVSPGANQDPVDVPTIDEFEVNGKTTKFITFGRVEDNTYVNTNSQLLVTLADSNPMAYDGLSFEFWVKGELNTEKANNKRLFALGGMSGYSTVQRVRPAIQVQEKSKKDEFFLDSYRGSNIVVHDGGGTNELTSYTRTEGWHHCVYSFWKETCTTDESTGITTGTWGVRLVVDGVTVKSVITGTRTFTDYSKMKMPEAEGGASVPFNVLAIGGGAHGEGKCAYAGSFGSFKLYAGELSEEQAKKHYLDSCENFQELAVATGNMENVTRENLNFDIRFTDQINTETLSNIKILDEKGQVIKSTYKSYDETDNIASFVLNDYLIPDNNYEVCFEQVMDKIGRPISTQTINFVAKSNSRRKVVINEPIYRDSSNEIVSDLITGGSVEIKIDVQSVSGETITFGAAMMIYDSTGTIVRVVPTEAVDVNSTDSITLKNGELQLHSDYTIKIFVWELNDARGIIPAVLPLICE